MNQKTYFLKSFWPHSIFYWKYQNYIGKISNQMSSLIRKLISSKDFLKKILLYCNSFTVPLITTFQPGNSMKSVTVFPTQSYSLKLSLERKSVATHLSNGKAQMHKMLKARKTNPLSLLFFLWLTKNSLAYKTQISLSSTRQVGVQCLAAI